VVIFYNLLNFLWLISIFQLIFTSINGSWYKLLSQIENVRYMSFTNWMWVKNHCSVKKRKVLLVQRRTGISFFNLKQIQRLYLL